MLLCYLFYYRELFCFLCFSKHLLGQTVLPKNDQNGNWTQTKMKGQMVSQTAGFQNHSRPKFKFQFHTSSVALGKLFNKSASFVLWCSSVVTHIWHVKGPEFHPSMEKGKNKTNKEPRTFQGRWNSLGREGTCHPPCQPEFDLRTPRGKKTNSIKLSSDL